MTIKKKTLAKAALTNALFDLLHKKPFQKISVNELCESAHISRSAFYANFEDKYDLLAYCLNEKTDEWNLILQTYSQEQIFTVFLDLIQKNERFFNNIFEADTDGEIAKLLYQFLSHNFMKILEKRIAEGLVLPGPIETVASFYIGGLSVTTLQWMKSNYNIPKEELAACQYQLLKDLF